jgi:hypothetical protein
MFERIFMMSANRSLEPLVKNNLLPTLRLILIVAILMTAASISGIIFPDLVYPDSIVRDTFLTNDLVNLMIGLPLFMAGLLCLAHQNPLGLFLLPGALVYVIYNYFAYLVGRPWSIFTILTFSLVALAGYALFDLLTRVDHEAVKDRLEGLIPRRFSGWLLLAMGVGFFGLALTRNIQALVTGDPLPLGDQVASLSDLLVSFLWAGGGILLLRRKGLGYTAGLGLLIAASTLFVGLILFFLLAPLFADRPLDWIEISTVFGMGMICFIPTALYWRGTLKSGSS